MVLNHCIASLQTIDELISSIECSAFEPPRGRFKQLHQFRDSLNRLISALRRKPSHSFATVVSSMANHKYFNVGGSLEKGSYLHEN